MKNEEKICEYCGEEPATEEIKIRTTMKVCKSCSDSFDQHGDVTGYCSLDCMFTGKCDGSC